jgi:thiol-disulfide isomerase/thioredoxin
MGFGTWRAVSPGRWPRSGALVIFCGLLMMGAARAADPIELVDAEGMQARLDGHVGQVVVINLWATWCVPCITEIPDLMALEEELHGRGMQLLAVSMDDPADLGAVEAFRQRHFPDFQTLLRGETDMDTLVSVVDFAWNGILPTTYLIDRQGKLAQKIQGKRSVEQFRADIESLLD